MFIKIYQYHLKPEKVEEYFSLQDKATEIYKRYLGGFHTMYFKSNDDETMWIEISRYNDEEEYNNAITIINQQKQIQELFVEFQSMLVGNKNELKEMNFTQIKEMNKF